MPKAAEGILSSAWPHQDVLLRNRMLGLPRYRVGTQTLDTREIETLD